MGGATYTILLFKLIFFLWFGLFAIRIRRRRRQCGFRRLFNSSIGLEGDISVDDDESASDVLANTTTGLAEGDIGGVEI